MEATLEAGVESIGRFQIRKVLGEGGAGIVYLAHDPQLKRDVALKTLAVTAGEETQLLLEEARAVSTLRHPCIVPVFEAGDWCGAPYLVFEYVTGETLHELIRRCGAMPAEDALRIAALVLDGLAHAHQNGVLHRDIKPANIMLGSDGMPRIMDFGAASRNQFNWLDAGKVGVDRDFIGTPPYMAPEYIERRLFSARTDIYAAGLVVCEMLTGRRVFEGGSMAQLLQRIADDPIVLPPGPGLNEKIIACLLKALAKDPEARYASVVEMKQALLRAAGTEAREPAAADGHGTLEFLLRRIKLKKEFPAMAESISKVNNIIHSDSGSVTALTNAVIRDFALTNKLIKLANSSYYNQSGNGGVSTVSGAVYRLGFDTVRNIVIGLLLFEQMKDRNQARDLMSECVQAILGGTIAREICAAEGYGNPEETFVCAMMHNLGRMLSIYYFPEETEEIKKILALGEAGEDQAARRVLGASYTELGQGVAKSWGFPQKIVASMDKSPPHHGARVRPGPEETTRLVVCLASELSAAVVVDDPQEQKKRAAQTLDKFKGRLRLKPKTAEAMFASSLEKFSEYAVAVGWKLDRTLSQRLSRLQSLSPETVRSEAAAGAMTKNAQQAELEPSMQASVHARALSPAPLPEHARAGREVLAGGIQDITNAMVEGSSLNDVLRIIIETIHTGIGFDRVIFALRDPRQQRMLGRFGLGEGTDALAGQFNFALAFAPDVFHIALQKNVDVFISDTGDAKIVSRIPDWYRRAFSAGAFLLLPIVVKEQAFGMIYADATEANSIRIAEDELKLLRTLRNQAVLALRQSA